MVRYLQNLEEFAPVGYTVGVHIRFASPMYMRSTYPQAWQDLYSTNNYALRDPLVFWGISKTGVIRWSDINLPDPFGVMIKAAKHGLIYGAVASCGKITSRTIVGVSRDDREFTDSEMRGVAAIADALHEVTEPPTDLTPAMIEALRLVGEGFRHAAAAAELGISESAFKARLSSARDRLGAQTTAEALRMAREFRLI
ncbi:LuxR family transcriptional regulator [Jannaschia faecimaris]|uniref:LuxR family transcriptional regulator n=1 Tax=Jannaschia faecimaris TaxID=1244108 RepID=A0A1H3TSD3_9RHOB|nr:autoinducer binding domain-containing protein [Jannaschia faecimaris]SDZ53070.1 LuxR family transcriptional regulator [Jannaschia faecimaris]